MLNLRATVELELDRDGERSWIFKVGCWSGEVASVVDSFPSMLRSQVLALSHRYIHKVGCCAGLALEVPFTVALSTGLIGQGHILCAATMCVELHGRFYEGCEHQARPVFCIGAVYWHL